jgi:hypothetical protein
MSFSSRPLSELLLPSCFRLLLISQDKTLDFSMFHSASPRQHSRSLNSKGLVSPNIPSGPSKQRCYQLWLVFPMSHRGSPPPLNMPLAIPSAVARHVSQILIPAIPMP